jgi:hypothetical protein
MAGMPPPHKADHPLPLHLSAVMLQVWLGIGDALAEAVEQGKLLLLQANATKSLGFSPTYCSTHAGMPPLTHSGSCAAVVFVCVCHAGVAGHW